MINLIITTAAAERGLRLGMDIHELSDAALEAKEHGAISERRIVYAGLVFEFGPDMAVLENVRKK